MANKGDKSFEIGDAAEFRVLTILSSRDCQDLERHAHESKMDRRGIDLSMTYQGLRVHVQVKSDLRAVQEFRRHRPEQTRIICLATGRQNKRRKNRPRKRYILTDEQIWEQFQHQFNNLLRLGYAWKKGEAGLPLPCVEARSMPKVCRNSTLNDSGRLVEATPTYCGNTPYPSPVAAGYVAKDMHF